MMSLAVMGSIIPPQNGTTPGRHPSRMAPLRNGTPTMATARTVPPYDQKAGGTHPTGMLSCIDFILVSLLRSKGRIYIISFNPIQ